MGFGRFTRVRSVSPFQSSALPIAIDFGVGSLKVLQLANGEKPTLVAAAAVRTPDHAINDHAKRLAFQADILPELLKNAGFRGKRAVCAIPAGQMFCKHLQLQKADGVDVGLLVRTAVSEQLACHPDALIYRHVEAKGAECPGGANKSEVVCMAAGRALVNKLMGAIKSAKLDPVAMHPEFTALLRAFELMYESSGGVGGEGGCDEGEGGVGGDANEPVLHLDLGYGSTKVLISHGGSLVFARTIALGGRHLDEAVSEQLGCAMAEARQRRLSLASLAPAGVASSAGVERTVRTLGAVASLALAGEDEGRQPDLSEPIECLTDEVSMCLRYHEQLYPGRRIRRAMFVGGEARHHALCAAVARRLRMPAHTGDPFAGLGRTGPVQARGVGVDEAQPGWAVALGLALSPTDL